MPRTTPPLRREAVIFKALSDETRLHMLGLLFREEAARPGAGVELCVCDVMEVLGITQSKASRHLRRLVDAGLLIDRKEAVWVYFRIDPEPEPVQADVLALLRDVLPAQVPAEMIVRLAEWRKRKRTGCASCSPRRTVTDRRPGERARHR
jgi:ArsR family transcriptional regulator, arsenate/arsenite/antimonite-responsive transcriptional repressor